MKRRDTWRARRESAHMPRPVAALYVASRSIYHTIDGVECYDEQRDARTFGGPWPVVAHPPCARWCRLAGLVQHRYPHLRAGEDGGIFAHALACVRRWGGVLEHPAYSRAWPAHGLRAPERGRWSDAGDGLGRVAWTWQGHYGHRASKATWLYVVSAAPLPDLVWERHRMASGVVSWTRLRGDGTRYEDERPRLSARETKATPPAFAALLIEIARAAGLAR